MQKVVEVINNLRELSGNSAIDYLKENKDIKYLRDVLFYTYNPDYKYGIKEDKYNKIEAVDGILNLSDDKLISSFLMELDRLAGGKSAKDKDVLAIKTFIENSKYPDLLRGILFKDLRIGMDIKTLNKVWNDFYFKYPYMGCKVFTMDNLKKIKYPALAQTKLDGLFCNAIVDPINKKVEYISRQGKPLNIIGSLDEELLQLKSSKKFVLNGEILCVDPNTNKPYPREISNGIIRRDTKTKDELNSIIIVCWDIIPYDNFVQGKFEVPYEKRFELLKHICKDCTKVKYVNTYEIENIDSAMQLFNKLYSQGEEGIVVKNKDGIWKDGKPAWQVKVKNVSECDLRAVGFEEGSGAYSGMCGTIICESEDKLLKVGIKPRTPIQAEDVWQNQSKYLNKILTVKYNSKIKRQDSDIYSLFLPVFVEWRDLDKTTADKLGDIQ